MSEASVLAIPAECLRDSMCVCVCVYIYEGIFTNVNIFHPDGLLLR